MRIRNISRNTATSYLIHNENLNNTFPNIGVGAFYNRDKLYAGLSIPNLLTSKHLENRDGITRIGAEAIHLFGMAGYVFDINTNLKLKPSILTKMVSGAPITADFSFNALFNCLSKGLTIAPAKASGGTPDSPPILLNLIPGIETAFSPHFSVTSFVALLTTLNCPTLINTSI